MLTISVGNGSTFEPIEAGTYPAVCYGLIDIGDQYSEKYGNWSHNVIIMWEIPGEKIEIDGKMVSRTISKFFSVPPKLGPKSTLRQALASWRGRDFTEQEMIEFDLRAVVGAPCLLSILHKIRKSDGQTTACVDSIMKMPKGMPVLQTTLDRVVFDIDEDPISAIDELPEWIQRYITNSRQYKTRTAPVTDVSNLDIPDESDEYEDDDIPF